MSKKIMLIPHGAGNIGSIMEVFHQLGYYPQVAESVAHINNADLAVIPGVGASGSAMTRLRETGFADAIVRLNENQRPIIGICVGAQVMFSKLYENDCTGLSLLAGNVVRITNREFNNGWCEIKIVPNIQENNIVKCKPLLLKTSDKSFYFNHGYQINSDEQMEESAFTSGNLKLLAYFLQNNLCGIQFHPEKSQVAGLRFISNTMKHYGF